MTKYEFLKNNNNVVDLLRLNGMINDKTHGSMLIYESVLNERLKGTSNSESLFEVSEKEKIHIDTIIKAVADMQKDIEIIN